MVVLHILIFILGCALVFAAILSAIRTFVVPRGGSTDWLTRSVFIIMRNILMLPLSWAKHTTREQALAYLSPASLLTLPALWLACVLLGYAGIYWALSDVSWSDAITTSRLSLLYLGGDIHGIPGGTIFAFSETVISLLLAAILVSYLPAIYAAFSQRETAVTDLETRAGTPPSPVKMLIRYHAIQGMDRLNEVWMTWQQWFATIEESHTALVPLVFYRSPQPKRSWVTAAGAVLDTASIVASTVDLPRNPEAELCIRAGYLCLRRIAAPFRIPFKEEPAADDSISISRREYEAVCDQLETAGVPLKSDRDQAWRDFAGWRVNYDAVLVGLAVLTVAPPGFWCTDRVKFSPRMVITARRSARRAATDAMAGRLRARDDRPLDTPRSQAGALPGGLDR